MVHFQALGAYVVAHPLAILVCVIAYMALGNLWYGLLFRKPWTKLAGMDGMKSEQMKKIMVPAMGMSILTGFVFAVVLGRGMQILDMSSWTYPLVIATILWFPFTALPFAQSYIYTQKSFKLWLIDTGYILVSLWVISLILFFMVK